MVVSAGVMAKSVLAVLLFLFSAICSIKAQENPSGDCVTTYRSELQQGNICLALKNYMTCLLLKDDLYKRIDDATFEMFNDQLQSSLSSFNLPCTINLATILDQLREGDGDQTGADTSVPEQPATASNGSDPSSTNCTTAFQSQLAQMTSLSQMCLPMEEMFKCSLRGYARFISSSQIDFFQENLDSQLKSLGLTCAFNMTSVVNDLLQEVPSGPGGGNAAMGGIYGSEEVGNCTSTYIREVLAGSSQTLQVCSPLQEYVGCLIPAMGFGDLMSAQQREAVGDQVLNEVSKTIGCDFAITGLFGEINMDEESTDVLGSSSNLLDLMVNLAHGNQASNDVSQVGGQCFQALLLETQLLSDSNDMCQQLDTFLECFFKSSSLYQTIPNSQTVLFQSLFNNQIGQMGLAAPCNVDVVAMVQELKAEEAQQEEDNSNEEDDPGGKASRSDVIVLITALTTLISLLSYHWFLY